MNTSSITERLRRLLCLTVDVPIRIDWLSAQQREGDRRSPFTGNGREYCDFRPYRPGDKPNQINWKAEARFPDRDPVITLHEEERNACISVLVDESNTMDMASTGLSKRELACILTASIMRSASRTNDTALFVSYDELGVKQYFGRRSSHELTRLAPAAVLDQDDRYLDQSGSGLARALRRLPLTRSLVFIISDMLNLTDEDLELLYPMGVRHEVVVLVTSDLRERELPKTRLFPKLPIPGFYPTVDFNGVPTAIWTTRAARERYAQQFLDEEAALFAKLDKANCKHASVHTEDSHHQRYNQLTQILSGQRSCLNLNVKETKA